MSVMFVEKTTITRKKYGASKRQYRHQKKMSIDMGFVIYFLEAVEEILRVQSTPIHTSVKSERGDFRVETC